MSMLLLVRSPDDLRPAVEAVNRLLTHRHRFVLAPRDTDEVLGIWIRSDLDPRLPASEERPEVAVGIREVLGLTGLWSLCWVEGADLRGAGSAKERRNRIVDALACAAGPEAGVFFPVFEATESPDAVEAVLHELQERYAGVVADTWFQHDDRQRTLVEPAVSR